jgi:thiol:disulfide interchange protein
MGFVRLALYIVGLLLVVAAAWVFLTQTPFADDVPAGVAIAVILLLVGLGVMVSANAIDDTVYRRRVVHDGDRAAGPRTRTTTTYDERAPYDDTLRTEQRETYVEERRF